MKNIKYLFQKMGDMMKKGFTLTELLVTIVIITMLLMIVLPTISNIINKNNDELCGAYEEMVYEYARINFDNKTSRIVLSEIDGLDEVKSKCSGYVIIDKTTDVYDYKPYLSCSNGCKTEGYDESLNESATDDATVGTCNNLTYNGTSQTLASGGLNVTYSDNTGINAGTYTVNVRANNGYTFSNGLSHSTLSCSIEKGSNPITVTSTQSWSATYSTSSQTKAITGASNAAGTVTYSINSQKQGSTNVSYFSISGTTLTMNANTPVNTYTVVIRATAAGNDNYASGYKDITMTVTIGKAASSITCRNGTYSSGSFQTYTSASGCASITNKTVTSGGVYTVTCVGDSNHNNSSCKSTVHPCWVYAYDAQGSTGIPSCVASCPVMCRYNFDSTQYTCTTGPNDYPIMYNQQTGYHCWCYQ